MFRFAMITLIGLLLIVLPVDAQDATETPVEPVSSETVSQQALLDAIARAEAAADRAGVAADHADARVETSINFLNTFQTIAVLLGAAATLGSVFVVRQFNERLKKAESLVSKQETLIERQERRFNQIEADYDQVIRMRTEIITIQSQVNESLQRIEKQVTNTLNDALKDVNQVVDSSNRARMALSLLPVAESQYQAHDLKGALATYERALELDNDNPIVHYRLGYIFTQQGDLENAMPHLERALAIEAKLPPALAAFGYLYRRMAERETPNTQKYNDYLARAEIKLNDALSYSRRLVDDDGEPWLGSLGGLYRRRGQIDLAIEVYKEAETITPFSSYPPCSLALLYAEKNDYDAMFDAYRRAKECARRDVASQPDYWGYFNLVIAQIASGDPENDIRVNLLALFTSVPPDSPFPLETLIKTLERLETALKNSRPERVPLVKDVIAEAKSRFNHSRFG